MDSLPPPIETENEDGDKILSVTLWTAEGEKKLNTVKVTGSSLDALTTGAVVSYDLDSDGNIEHGGGCRRTRCHYFLGRQRDDLRWRCQTA